MLRLFIMIMCSLLASCGGSNNGTRNPPVGVDKTAPMIALLGVNLYTLTVGSVYVDAGSKVTDNVDVGLVATMTGSVNTAVVGTYTLTYNVKDKAG
ncbi:MAG: DUF5011 domain-containing protein, partial [Mariprofundaceae bacterium]|nr:DUF5011 domain-containing protein [Mariprofundaceae bacterium]